MTAIWLRRAFMAAACASAALLAACGGGDTVSALTPSRIVVFGDAFNDLGAAGGGKYTVNDGGVDNWIQQVAMQYGRPVASLTDGGQGYARGNARISSAVDAAGGAAPSITQQITNFQAAGSFGTNDLVIVGGGISDIVAQAAAVKAGTQTTDQLVANAEAAGRELGAQVRRLVGAGAKFVVVTGTYDLGRSPWSVSTGFATALSRASGRFNDQLLLSITDLGANVLYVDAAFYYNLVTSSPSNYSFDNANDPVCTTVDPGPGIGIGPGEVNSSLCTNGTVAGRDYARFAFADKLYATPQLQRLFGDYAYTRIKARF